ncbi:hypothetical protein HYP84_gp123 [Shigella phage MK-13]|uniref:Uncharacterized protein n=1 Tax=Shigella phage MK-13 TaxID=2530042 RepID=A0A513QBT8_9CAUD|nr:hypothetical protein HYP84_gp123 [Shigella phage MK-13]QBJ04408.1 hypothetical protein MK13_00179 [Shigella phage MK-13]
MSKPNFLQFMQEKDQLDEAFNSAPYELTMGKKNAGDVFFTFIDEDEKEYRIQFYTPQGLGKNVRQVFIGQKRGSVYPDAIARFKNPMRVIASMIEATKQFLATPLGKTIDGYAVNFSKKALERGMTLIPKIIRQSGLKQKLNVMDLTYAPVPDRGYVWLVRKGKDPAQVFDGPKMQGITWDDPDKVGDVPVQNNTPDVGTSSNNPDWNISVMAKSNGIFSSVVKVVGANDVTLSSNDLAIMVKDGAMAKIARTQTIAQVTVFNKEYVGRGEVDRKLMAASDRQGMGWELKSGGKIVAYVEFGVGAIQSNPDYEDKGQWKYDNRNQRGKQPQMVYSITKGRNTYSAMLSAHSSEPGTYVLHGSDGKSFRGPSADLIIGQARLPSPPIDMYNQFTRDSKEFWAQIDITEGVKVPSNGEVITKTKSTFTIRWNMGFPPSGPYAGAVLETTVLRVRENDYVISNIASTKNKTLNDLKSYDYRGDINSLLKEEGERYSLANSQLSTLTSISYNPNKLGYDLVSVGSYGEVRFNGQDIGLPSNRQVVINAVMKMNNEYEKTGGGKKTGVDLATYAGSIRDNAPKGRDLDWQIYASRDGQTLNVDWDITFRRNTTEGAYREFKAQIDRANQYLQTLYQDAKSKGYNPTEPNLMTLARAQQSDQWAKDDGESAYSEYEQSLGGNMQIKI